MATDASTQARDIESPGTADPTPAPASVNPSGAAGDNRPTRQRVSPNWTLWHTLILLLIVAVLGAVGLNRPPIETYYAGLGLLTIFATVAGHGIMGLWRGVLIDERNKLSLSRLQMLAWTILVLSGILAAVLWNSRDPNNKYPFSIAVPAELWWLMGISTTSLVGSPLIRSTKTGEPLNRGEAPPAAAAKELNRTMSELVRQNVPANTIDRHGKIIYWKWPEDARFADLFQGDEVGNAAHLDLGKVQMFFFTLILVFTYAVILGRMFVNVSSAITEFPPVDQGMVALLGISHAGFLSNNAVPHSVS